MNSRLHNALIAGGRALLFLASGIVILLSLPGPASAQESLLFHLPDSIRMVRDPFLIPSLSFAPSQLFGSQLSFYDQAMIASSGLYTADQAAWKRSFLLGATVYKNAVFQPYQWTVKKDGFFQGIQAVLGVAELAGAAYLGYKAIKKEPITKKK